MSDLLKKHAGESVAAGGENSPFNIELSCPSCRKVLGLLGTFVERVATAHDATALVSIGVPIAQGATYRRVHCGFCHTNVFLHNGDKTVTHIASPAFAGSCAVCGGAPSGDTRKLSERGPAAVS